MLNDLAWRKVPRNIIRDENIEYIASKLPEHLRAAPMLLYFIMYCKADDEGVVDLDDGAIYSRLMMNTAQPEEIIYIAKLMAKYKLLLPVLDGTAVYIILDWDVPARPGFKGSRTMEERRACVAAKIKAEQEQKQRDQVAIDFDAFRNATAPKADFFCTFDDKNAKNVDTERDKREIRENSEILRENLREIEREKTHTEVNSGAFEAPYVASEKMQEISEQTDIQNQQSFEIKKPCNPRNLFNSSPEAPITESVNSYETKRVSRDADIKDVYVVIRDFFAKNCLGFQESKYITAINDLSECICMLEDEVNTAPVIALVFCQQFKQLTETDGYFKNLPMYPSELLKPSIYRRVLSMASKILCNKKPINHTWSDQATALNKLAPDKVIPGNDMQVYDEMKKVFVESNIDPASEHPLRDYLLKKVTAIK